MLTVKEVARELRVSTKTVRDWIASGNLQAARLGPRTIRIEETALRELVSTRAARPTGETS